MRLYDGNGALVAYQAEDGAVVPFRPGRPQRPQQRPVFVQQPQPRPVYVQAPPPQRPVYVAPPQAQAKGGGLLVQQSVLGAAGQAIFQEAPRPNQAFGVLWTPPAGLPQGWIPPGVSTVAVTIPGSKFLRYMAWGGGPIGVWIVSLNINGIEFCTGGGVSNLLWQINNPLANLPIHAAGRFYSGSATISVTVNNSTLANALVDVFTMGLIDTACAKDRLNPPFPAGREIGQAASIMSAAWPRAA